MMALGRTQKEWVNHMRKCALEVGIPDSYRMIIMFLSRHEGANQKELAEFANKTTAAINQTVKEMQSNGYIKMETDESDRRYTKLYLTEKGLEKSTLLRERLHKSDEVITNIIGREREDEIVALLNDIHRVIKEELI
ncbi:MAG: winged helix-turn-helix transcriptional regulator [Clostridia bacterium]|nr:winged helix-turn-helix transcriptional regulator [Clostridia bacterium]